jgi:hypothetical protein
MTSALNQTMELPPQGFGLRQSSGAFVGRGLFQSARGLAQSKTLARSMAQRKILTTRTYENHL